MIIYFRTLGLGMCNFKCYESMFKQSMFAGMSKLTANLLQKRRRVGEYHILIILSFFLSEPRLILKNISQIYFVLFKVTPKSWKSW